MKFSLSLGKNKQGHQLTGIMALYNNSTALNYNFKKYSFLFLGNLNSYFGEWIKPDVTGKSTT